MSSALSVADTARRLGVSRRQVQRLVSAGTLRAERGVGGALVVDPASVPAVRPGRGRPWSPAMAWGALWELSGLPAEGLTPAQRRRLPGLLAAAEPDRLVAAVRQRATGESFTASPRALASLAPEVALTGASAGRRRGRQAPERLEAYVTPGRLARLVAHHPIARQAGGNVTLHVADFAPVEQRAEMPSAVVAVDLAGSGDPDERADGLVRLDDLLQAYRAQRAHAGSRRGPAADDVTRTWMTAADVAGAVGEELRRGDDDFAFRMVARGLADLRARRRPADVARFLAPPPSTGDRRWDVLLAAVVRRECRRRGIPAPGWTAVEPLRPWWFPLLASPALAARTMQRTPVDLSLLGIWLDGNALETR